MQVIKLFKKNPHIIELGCIVHARRKLFDFHHSTESPIAKTALDFFACLYQIEGQAKEASVQERTEIRQKHAVPVLETMKKWLDEQYGSLPILRKPHQTHSDREKELAVCGLPKSGPKQGGHLQFIKDRQTQRTRALCMVKKRIRKLTHAKKQRHSRVASV